MDSATIFQHLSHVRKFLGSVNTAYVSCLSVGPSRIQTGSESLDSFSGWPLSFDAPFSFVFKTELLSYLITFIFKIK